MSIGSYSLLEHPVISTKITVPRSSAGSVRRPRLTERVSRGVEGPLTLLMAPAGFGKTNVLVQWANETDLARAWLTIDSEDNDPRRLFRHLISALQTLEPGLGEEALEFILSTRGGGLEIGLTLLINEVSALSRDLILILDEFQSLHDHVVLQGIEFLIKHLPDNLHLVIASRTTLPFSLAALRVRSRVCELGAGDLRFTEDEIASFFLQTLALQLSADTVRTIEIRTDGWIAGLQMAAISMREDRDPEFLLAHVGGGAHVLVDYLAAEVVDRQSAEVRQFLLRSSILEPLTGSLCEAVVDPAARPGYGAAMLRQLERANLFVVALDEQHEWFRYHRLFSDVLRHIERETNPAEIPMLHKRAALWYEQHGNPDDAFKHALASADLEWMADLIERNSQSMIAAGEMATLTRWISELPNVIIHQRPRLGLAYAWGAIAAYRLDLAQYWLGDVQQTLAELCEQANAGADAAELPFAVAGEDAGLWNVRGGLAVCQSTLALLSEDVERAAEFSRQATVYLQEQNPFVRSFMALDDSLFFVLSGDAEKAIESLRDTVRLALQANNLLVLIIATWEISEMQTVQAQLGRAWATLQKAEYMAVGPNGEPLALGGLGDIGYGAILLERDLLQEAQEYLERGRKATQALWPISNLDAMIAQAQLYHARGDIAESQAVLAEASRLALSTESSQWDDTIVSSVAVRLALQCDDLAQAALWWKTGRFPDLAGSIAPEDYPYAIYEHLALTHARFLLVSGENSGRTRHLLHARELLERLLPETERLHRVRSQIEVLVLQAMVQSSLGNDRAQETLLHALALGEPEGFRRIYLDEGRRLRPLLLLCASERPTSGSYLPSRAFMGSLLDALDHRHDPAHPQAPRVGSRASRSSGNSEDVPSELLSPRELEVLSLIAEGKSNQEIATQLYLALNTVKRHAYNIYAKLNVNKRTQAVSRGRLLGLID